MLRKTILLPALLLAFHSLQSQKPSLGIKLGYTLSDAFYKKPDGFNAGTGNNPFGSLSSFHAGIDSRMGINGRFSIVAGLQYARKGYKGKLDWPTGPAPVTCELHYLNLPIVADVRIWKGLALQGGVEAGRLLDARLKSTGIDADAKVFYEDFDLGLVAGLEYRFNDSFFLGLRHVFGISAVQKLELTNDTGTSIGASGTYNRDTQFSAGYRYAFGK